MRKQVISAAWRGVLKSYQNSTRKHLYEGINVCIQILVDLELYLPLFTKNTRTLAGVCVCADVA